MGDRGNAVLVSAPPWKARVAYRTAVGLGVLHPLSVWRTMLIAPTRQCFVVQGLETLLWAICRLEHRADELLADMAKEVG